MRRLLCVVILFLLFGCSSEKSSEVKGQEPREAAGNAALGNYSIEIRPLPLDATRKSTMYLTAQGFAPSDATIEWLVNGSPVASRSVSQFNAAETRKGDKVQAKALINGREILSNIVQINNTPPELSKVRFVTEGLKSGETLGVEANADDVDGDDVRLTFEWTKNGEPAGDDKTLKVQVKRGDKLTVRITPFDGEAYGRSVVLEREITNSPPTITGHRKSDFDGKVYTYQVKASDPDGDPLAYSLQSGPPGMTIDASTGLVKWEVPEDFKGKASFTVSVSDGHGGEASQKMSVDIKREQK